ncbi:NAD-dependent epimerase/dehydratase family protein [Panacibacter ginsenosidivorans]|uniref:NAD-dependent epimerase/dehydratase family protein n=1 Tax=Panacibacter ginsenosidivorans TaxID=1813871 RepID=A0A5B8VBF5_9BACT|nr:NAD-dependent epimerase/dehydratase family protein [Panacibacter ginsenosidivorans]QEC68355.1 NAD-dependent epimerase/dehydratase family protein [Panacibacter ginsenosidivorans]
MNLHTILGAGGAVSSQLVPVLKANNESIRLVSRNPKPIEGAEIFAADITNYTQTLNAVKGSSVVYLLAGLQYDVRVWKVSWPKIMTNVINACKAAGSKLIFFDNVYMYGKVDGVMTEETPFNPCSKKGEIRAAIATQLLDEMRMGNIKALIARAADFYGPVGFKTSVPNMLVFENLKNSKKAQWLANAKVPHSFTYVPDAAKALYMLANDDTAFGQTWHVPTAGHPLTGEEFIKQAAEYMKVFNNYSTLPVWMMQLAGIFNRPIKESVEMIYQSQFPYIFNSTKFDKAFNFEPTSYQDGIRETAIWTMEQ